MPEKSKLIRKAKKVLAFYEHNFNITKPYKIIRKLKKKNNF